MVNSDVLPTAPKVTFRASLLQNGTMSLAVNNKQVGTAMAGGVFKGALKTGIRVGVEDKTGDMKVANYPDTFRLRSMYTGGKLEMFTPGSAESVAATSNKAAVAKVLVVNVVKDVMKFDKTLLTAKAGTTIQIVLNNPDFMQHNLVVVKPKMLEKVGTAADNLARDPDGAKLNYVPRMPEVLAATPLVNPAGKFTLTFKVPDAAGDYPFVCTFPGHWRIMKGILRVSK
jgi:azurin